MYELKLTVISIFKIANSVLTRREGARYMVAQCKQDAMVPDMIAQCKHDAMVPVYDSAPLTRR